MRHSLHPSCAAALLAVAMSWSSWSLMGCSDVIATQNPGTGGSGGSGTGGTGTGGTGTGGTGGTAGSGGSGGTSGSGGSPAMVTVTLDAGTVPDVLCNGTWMEAGVTLSLVQTTTDDCAAGSCFFNITAGSVSLFPARLNLDVSGLSGKVISAEADVSDACGANCTRLLLHDGANLVATTGNTGSGQETLSANGGGMNIDRIAVSSCEGGVNEVRIELEVAP